MSPAVAQSGERKGREMGVQWKGTSYPGVRYYEHESRRTRNGQPDKNYSIRYTRDGVRIEEGVGWASEGWNPEKISKNILGVIKEGIRTGAGPFSLADMRRRAAARQAEEEEARLREEAANMTVKDFFMDHFLPRIKREKRSWLTDQQRYDKEIDDALGDFPLRAVTEEDVQEFADSLCEKEYAPATVRQYVGIVKHLFYIAMEIKLDGVRVFNGVNPVKDVLLPEVYNERVRYATPQEVDLLLGEACTLESPDLHDAIILSLNTGLRLGELKRQRWMDVDIYGQMVTVPDEARRKPGGQVPMNRQALAVYLCRRELSGGAPAEPVFPPVAGGAYRNNLSESFRAIADRLGLNDGITDRRYKLTFHSMRHTFASWLALKGTDIYRIQKLMRHRDIKMTMRYAHLLPDATRGALDRLSA